MNRFERTVLCGVPIGLVVAELAVRALGGSDPPLAMLSPFATFPLFTAAALGITVCTMRRRDFVPAALLALLLMAAKVALELVRHRSPFGSLSTVGLGLWYGCLIVSLWRMATARGEARLRELDLLLLRLALPLGVCLSVFGLMLTRSHIDQTYDNFFYAFDGLLGPPIAAIAATLCDRYPLLRQATYAVYESYWIVLAVFMLGLLRLDERRAGELMSRWVVASLIGWVLFFVLPGVGPDVAFYRVSEVGLPAPETVPAVVMAMPLDTAPRNAMPSLHTVWVLLLIMVAWRMNRAWFAAAVIFAAATLFATLGLREHYLIDLVVAVPLSVSVYALGAVLDGEGRWQHKLPAVLGGAVLTALLLLAVRYGIATLRGLPGAAAALAIAVVILSVGLHATSETAKTRATGMRLRPRPG
jgi:hypothetical protein